MPHTGRISEGARRVRRRQRRHRWKCKRKHWKRIRHSANLRRHRQKKRSRRSLQPCVGGMLGGPRLLDSQVPRAPGPFQPARDLNGRGTWVGGGAVKAGGVYGLYNVYLLHEHVDIEFHDSVTCRSSVLHLSLAELEMLAKDYKWTDSEWSSPKMEWLDRWSRRTACRGRGRGEGEGEGEGKQRLDEHGEVILDEKTLAAERAGADLTHKQQVWLEQDFGPLPDGSAAK